MTTHADPEKVVLRSSSMLSRLAAVREGMGIGYLGSFVAERDKGLERLDFGTLPSVASVWLLVHVDMRTNARVRAFVDFLRQEFKTRLQRLGRS